VWPQPAGTAGADPSMPRVASSSRWTTERYDWPVARVRPISQVRLLETYASCDEPLSSAPRA
jgi:hypothetical protein